ncbi:unnamed protein product [Staurois parvus]|uniref:Uncharacterized protein n=1 Tax=Staurois parvus TaxID=386267 RepID=A0ABN9C132_9NEOB|nr:unnamed protein product [Staurois parvus]
MLSLCVLLESQQRANQHCQDRGRADIVNAGSGETGYSECRVGGDRI